jgi:hypothetical protein
MMKSAIVRFFDIDSPLLQFARNVTSQNGEDGVLEHIITAISPANRYCVEFGAWDGKLYSNCYSLIVNASWKGLMIEANSAKYKELVSTYAGHKEVRTLNRFVQLEGPDSIDSILGEVGAPRDIGVMSIDVDGIDYYIWESLRKHRPEVVIIEFNATVPNDVIFIQDRSTRVNQGCSLLSLVMLGKEIGYELACCTGWNAFFVAREKFHLLGIRDNFICKLFQPIQDGRIFQGYDGYIHVIGMDRLVWKGGVPVTSADFQVLPESLRRWEDAPAQ